jgi:hypothetical protein
VNVPLELPFETTLQLDRFKLRSTFTGPDALEFQVRLIVPLPLAWIVRLLALTFQIGRRKTASGKSNLINEKNTQKL